MDKNDDVGYYKQLSEDFANYATEDRQSEQRMAYAATSIAMSLLVLIEQRQKSDQELCRICGISTRQLDRDTCCRDPEVGG